MSTVAKKIAGASSTIFSFEILPPLRGNSIRRVYDIIDKLRPFNPQYINITSHHSEMRSIPTADGRGRQVTVKRRPGTVAIAAAIQQRYGITAVPHIICSGFTKEETEYALLDLNFLGIHNLLLLRGDKKNSPAEWNNASVYHPHATDLQRQVNMFNSGMAIDGTTIEGIDTPFSYGMACYPELHEEADSADTDLAYALDKVQNGAEYLVTQMFFDNEKYFQFVRRAREAGINVPIIPGIKPISKMRQRTLLPDIFHLSLPSDLDHALSQCTSDAQARAVGTEWCVAQCRELMAAGVPGLHFYTHFAEDSVSDICQQIF